MYERVDKLNLAGSLQCTVNALLEKYAHNQINYSYYGKQCSLQLNLSDRLKAPHVNLYEIWQA